MTPGFGSAKAIEGSPQHSNSCVRSTSSMRLGFAGKMAAAKLSGLIVADLFSDVLCLGAVDVAELSDADWQGLPSWKKLRPLEVRRLAATFA